jgi:M6 family metalloprotease-like protein
MRRNLLACTCYVGVLFSATAAFGHEPIEEEVIEGYKEDGTYDERMNRIETLKHFKMSEGNRQRAIYKIRRAELQAAGLTETQAAQVLAGGPQMAFPFTAQPELRSQGTVKTLTILIDFSDRRAANELPGLDAAHFAENIYGEGTTVAKTHAPYESVRAYYKRASQGKLTVQGNVLGWHSFPNTRSSYSPQRAPSNLPLLQRQRLQAQYDNTANFNLVSKAMDAFDASHDFSQYDNDNDGDVDLVTILYAGPPEGWGSFWWAYRWEFFMPAAATKTFDGKRLKQFVFQFVDTRGPSNTDFKPVTLLHEFGHALGLADYYDYDRDIGPDGGVGGLDMMHANKHNQCAFSRWLLDWIKPTIISSGAPAEYQLNASSADATTNKAIAIFPGLVGTSAPSGEMFILEYRHRSGNDADMPTDGIVVWHVDAMLNDSETDFANDNSYTGRKLIKLVRADSATDFGDFDSATASTIFAAGTKLLPTATGNAPTSKGYNGPTHIAIDQISPNSTSCKLRIGFLQPTTPIPAPPADVIVEADGSPPQAGAAQPSDAEAAPEQTSEPTESVTAVANLSSDAPIDLDVLEELDRKLAAAKPEQLREIWSKIEQQEPADGVVTNSSITRQMVMTHWAAKQGEQAMDALLELPTESEFVQKTYAKAMESWANQAPIEAGQWYLAKDQEALRKSELLKAGTKFTKPVFESMFLQNQYQTVSGLEQLHRESEVAGAVAGLWIAGKHFDEGTEKLAEQLQDAKVHTKVIHATIHRLEALDAAAEAAAEATEEIADPAERAEVKQFLETDVSE